MKQHTLLLLINFYDKNIEKLLSELSNNNKEIDLLKKEIIEKKSKKIYIQEITNIEILKINSNYNEFISNSIQDIDKSINLLENNNKNILFNVFNLKNKIKNLDKKIKEQQIKFNIKEDRRETDEIGSFLFHHKHNNILNNDLFDKK